MSRLLLDTHAFLWWVNDAPEITAAARQAIADANNEVFLSLASYWEMSIKSSLGKLRLSRPFERFVSDQLTSNSFTLLNIELRHLAKVEKLPFYHRDPFDRLLIAQAMIEKMTLITVDNAFTEYGVKMLW